MIVIARAVSTAASLLALIGAAFTAGPSFASDIDGHPAVAILTAAVAPAASAALAAPDFSSADSSSTEAAAVGAPAPAPADDAVPLAAAEPAPATLAEAVAANLAAEPADADQACLAASVYFEAKGEPLEGQLAVAETVLNRTRSGRFPETACGVVRQHGQFSFVRGGALPSVDHERAAWKQAVAIAAIATGKLWKPVAPEALFFHARRVSPGWQLTRVASLGNHIFYR